MNIFVHQVPWIYWLCYSKIYKKNGNQLVWMYYKTKNNISLFNDNSHNVNIILISISEKSNKKLNKYNDS